MAVLVLTGTDVHSTCWRGNAALEWRSWRLWLKNTSRMGSLFQTSWRKQSPSSPWEKPCCHTTATPNMQETFYVCFLTQRKTWLHCAFKAELEWTIENHWNCIQIIAVCWSVNDNRFYWCQLHLCVLMCAQNVCWKSADCKEMHYLHYNKQIYRD